MRSANVRVLSGVSGRRKASSVPVKIEQVAAAQTKTIKVRGLKKADSEGNFFFINAASAVFVGRDLSGVPEGFQARSGRFTLLRNNQAGTNRVSQQTLTDCLIQIFH